MANLSFYHGVTVQLLDVGPRTIAVPSSSIIGLTALYTPGEGLAEPNKPVLITSEPEAARAFGITSPMYKHLQLIYKRSKAVVSCVGVPVPEIGEETTQEAANASAIIGGVDPEGKRYGMQAQLDAKSRLNVQPRLLICPGYSSQTAVMSAMDSIAGKLRAIAIVEGTNTTDEAAVEAVKNSGSKRIYYVDPGIRVWDTETNAEIDFPNSAAVAALFAWTDSEYGFWESPSNKELAGVIGTTRPIEYLYGDETSRANLLNAANISTIIREGGFRLWGNRTLSSDPKWAFVTRVRTTDIVMDAILAGHQWAVDRGITKTYVKDVTDGLNNFMQDLKNQGCVLGFECYPDPDLNTASQLEQGRIYWNIRFTDVPPAENPIFRVEVTNQWVTEVLDYQN